MILDLDLIRDIVLYEVNHQSIDGRLFDVDIKATEVVDGHKLGEVSAKIGDRKTYIIIHFDKILVYDGQHLDRVSDDTTIDVCDYVSLTRQKKLKDIGV